MNQVVITEMLQRAGHQVTVVENGARAVLAVAAGGIDLVLMDLEMPEMNGLAATRAIRAAGHAVPILAVTANVMADETAACIAAGMNGHVAKPISWEALLRAVDSALAGEPLHPATPPNEGPAAAAPVLDEAMLARLEQQIGYEKLAEIVEMFRSHLSQALGAIAQEHDHTPVIFREAHALSSLAGNLGFMELMGSCRLLMQAARQERTEGTRPQVAALQAAALRALDQLGDRYRWQPTAGRTGTGGP